MNELYIIAIYRRHETYLWLYRDTSELARSVESFARNPQLSFSDTDARAILRSANKRDDSMCVGRFDSKRGR